MIATKNLSASVKARLFNLAQARHESFNDLLGRYCIERLLYRLSKSEYADHFLLKGAMLFILWDGRMPRPTKDVDFLGLGLMEIDEVAEEFRRIATMPVSPDGLEFEADAVTAAEIREGQEFGAIRVKLLAHLGTARIPLQVDVGSGDAITPGPEVIDFPTLLDFPAPRVRAYPVYTVVAEKFEAMVSLGVRNTRMKDFHDLWFISSRFDFDGKTLHEAMAATFARRRIVLAGELLPFTADFIGDANRNAQWRGFLTRNGLKGPPDQFPALMAKLREFIDPARRPNALRWRPGTGWR